MGGAGFDFVSGSIQSNREADTAWRGSFGVEENTVSVDTFALWVLAKQEQKTTSMSRNWAITLRTYSGILSILSRSEAYVSLSTPTALMVSKMAFVKRPRLRFSRANSFWVHAASKTWLLKPLRANPTGVLEPLVAESVANRSWSMSAGRLSVIVMPRTAISSSVPFRVPEPEWQQSKMTV